MFTSQRITFIINNDEHYFYFIDLPEKGISSWPFFCFCFSLVLFFSYVFYFNSVQDLYKQENSFVHVYASKCSKGTLTYLLISI